MVYSFQIIIKILVYLFGLKNLFISNYYFILLETEKTCLEQLDNSDTWFADKRKIEKEIQLGGNLLRNFKLFLLQVRKTIYKSGL